MITKEDLEAALSRLEARLELSILRELRKAERWMIGIQVAYFFGTLASVWFLIHFK